jgi:hypothetical protein
MTVQLKCSLKELFISARGGARDGFKQVGAGREIYAVANGESSARSSNCTGNYTQLRILSWQATSRENAALGWLGTLRRRLDWSVAGWCVFLLLLLSRGDVGGRSKSMSRVRVRNPKAFGRFQRSRNSCVRTFAIFWTRAGSPWFCPEPVVEIGV